MKREDDSWLDGTESSQAPGSALADGGHTASSSASAFPIPDAQWFRSETMSDETVIMATHPSVVISLPSYLLGGVVSLVGLALGVSLVTGYLVELLGPVPSILLPVSGVFVLGGLSFAGWEHLTRTNTWYVVTDQQILHKTGVFNANTDPIDFASVTEIEVKRPFYLRPFGIGHIEVFAASTGGADLVMPSVPNVNVMVNTLKREKRKHAGNVGPTGTRP